MKKSKYSHLPRRAVAAIRFEPLPWYERYTKTELIISGLLFGIGAVYFLGHIVAWIIQ